MRDEVRSQAFMRCLTPAERSQLNMFSLVQQQRALLALAEEQVQLVELEQRLVQAEAQRGEPTRNKFNPGCGPSDIGSDARPQDCALPGSRGRLIGRDR